MKGRESNRKLIRKTLIIEFCEICNRERPPPHHNHPQPLQTFKRNSEKRKYRKRNPFSTVLDLSLSLFLSVLACLPSENMRIRKNAKLSPLWFSHASAPEALQTHVCQLNQSPWDAISFAQDSHQVSPPIFLSHRLSFFLADLPKPSLFLPLFLVSNLHFFRRVLFLSSSAHLGFPKTQNSFTFIVYSAPNSRLG